jgi:hypothetical protein
MATGPYNLPQGITIDGQQSQAVPRKVGAYDTEVVAGGVALRARLSRAARSRVTASSVAAGQREVCSRLQG